MNNFHGLWLDPSLNDAKNEVHTIIHNGFGQDVPLLTVGGKRNDGKLETWQEKCPLLALQLLMQRYKISKEGRNQIVLQGGKLKPCLVKPTHVRDCMYFGTNEDDATTKVTCFSEFILASNDDFLNPQTIAAMIYKDKSTADIDKRQTQKEKEDFKPW